MVEQDYYELLGISRGADEAAIKAAYRKLAKECHPDRHNGCSDKEAHFKAINEAYDVLKDPQKRAAYDRFGKAAFQNGGGGGDPFGDAGFNGFSDIFSSIFGEFMDPRGARQNASRGADLRYDLELTLEEAFAGVEKTIKVEALSSCEACDGRGCTRSDNCATACQTCGGMGKVRAQQGFFVVERGCPTCRGSGEVISDPCANCHGEGRALTQRKMAVKIPAGVDEGTRIRVGVSTRMRATRSPRPRPLSTVMPDPRWRNCSPDWTPAGILISIGAPSRPGSLMVPPSAAVVKLTGHSATRVVPSRA